MTFGADSHPSPVELSEFIHGRLDETVSMDIEAHLEDCDTCCRRLQEMSEGDRLIDALKRAEQSQRGDIELPRSHVARFELRRRLGEGGFGVVYEGWDPSLERDVAIKIPRLGGFLSNDHRERFLREARAAALLDHPGIVPVFEAGHDGEICYIATALCAGPTLSAWLKNRSEPVPFRQAALLVRQLAHSVQHAHGRGILHRDLKPGNVLLEPLENGRVDGVDFPYALRITDFGLAKIQGDLEHATRSSVVMGTPSYMAPEQAMGRVNEIGPQADVYAMGAMLYELLTGRPPLEGDSELETLQLVREEDPVRPSRLRPKTPVDLETIALTCLQKETHRRYASAEALGNDLQRFLDGDPIRARAISPLTKLWRWCRKYPVVSTLAISLIVTLTAVAIGASAMTLKLLALDQLNRYRAFVLELTGAEAGRRTRAAGQRYGSLGKLHRAVHLARELGLDDEAIRSIRTEAIACLALPDMEQEVVHPLEEPPWRYGFSFDADLQLYSLRKGSTVEVRSLADNRLASSIALTSPVTVAKLAPAGDGLAIVQPDIKRVSLWSLDGPAKRLTFDRVEAVAVDFCPRGETVAVAEATGNVFWLDVASGERVGSVQVDLSPSGCVFDRVGERLAVWGGDRIAVIATEQKRVVHNMHLSRNPKILTVAWSPDGTRIASGDSQHEVYVWTLGREENINLHGHQSWVHHVAFSNNGDVLVTSSQNNTTRVWEYQTARELLSAPGQVTAISRDDRKFAGINGHSVARWRANTAPERRTLRTPQASYEVYRASFDPTGRYLAGGCLVGVQIWDAISSRHLQTIHNENSASFAVFSGNKESTQLTYLNGYEIEVCGLSKEETPRFAVRERHALPGVCECPINASFCQ